MFYKNKLFKKIFLTGFITLLIITLFVGCKVEFPEKIESQNELTSSDSPKVEEKENVSSASSKKEVVVSNSSNQNIKEPSSSIKSSSTASKKSTPSNNSQQSQKPKPVEPENATIDKTKTLKCTLSIRCDEILKNMDLLNKNKVSLVPKNGIIYQEKTIVFSKGESVFDVLLRETKKSRIHMEFESVPLYNSNYIEGINNLYEFDCGEGSGWMYKINGWFPNYGASRYQLKDGDKIEWHYTLDLGHDLGQGFK